MEKHPLHESSKPREKNIARTVKPMKGTLMTAQYGRKRLKKANGIDLNI